LKPSGRSARAEKHYVAPARVQRKNNRMSALADARFIEAIDGMAQLRWKQTGHHSIGPETTALLHFLRDIRNGGAHPAETRKLATTPRDTARLISQTAAHLWEEIGNSRKALQSTIVQPSQKGDVD